MLKPINNHVLIEPLIHSDFIPTDKGVYEEIGLVIDFDEALSLVFYSGNETKKLIQKGDKVYFDSWLAAKYPRGKGQNEFYWLVKFDDIRAIERDDKIPE